MPKRWVLLQARPLESRRDPVDPEPLEAAKVHLQRPPSMREELAGYIRSLQAGTLDQDAPEVDELLRDFVEDDEEDRVLSDYQLRVLAMELHEAEEPPPVDQEPAAPEPEPEPAPDGG